MNAFELKSILKPGAIGGIVLSTMLASGTGCAGHGAVSSPENRQVPYAETAAAAEADKPVEDARTETQDHKVAQSQDPHPVVSGIAYAAKAVAKGVVVVVFTIVGLVLTAI